MRLTKGHIIQDRAAYVDLLGRLAGQPLLAVDCETEEFSDEKFLPWELELRGVGVYSPDAYGFIVAELVDDDLNQLLKRSRLIMHNAKFDLQVLQARGFEVDSYAFDDTLVMSWLLDENRFSHKLKDLAHGLLKVAPAKITKFKDLRKRPIKDDGTLLGNLLYDDDYRRWLAETAKYCLEDCWYTWQLRELLDPKLDEDQLRYTYEALELPFVGVLRRMEKRGITLDVPYLQVLGTTLDEQLYRVRAEINETVGHAINPDSPVQLKQLFYEQLKYDLPDDLRTKDGKLTTDVKALDYLADELNAPVAKLVKKHRELAKLKGTYVDGLIERQRGNVIHAGFHHTGTTTGRLSSSSPNLQNIPRKDGEFNIRHAFIARPGHKFVIGDYSQIELRLMAYYSQCQAMIKNYELNGDLYKTVAAEIGSTRQEAKAVVLGLNYGRTAYGLSHGIKRSVDDCQKFIDEYFVKFPEVKRFMDATTNTVRRDQRVRTICRRWRRFPEYKAALNLNDFKTMKRVERQATNSVIQGSAADVCKVAMRNLDEQLRGYGYNADILVQVHDELIVEVADSEVVAVTKLVKQVMEQAIDLNGVPLIVEPKVSDRWLK
jgi:DNA polymerase I